MATATSVRGGKRVTTTVETKPKRKTKMQQELEKAWKKGYDSGWNDRAELPKRVGVSAAATVGYKKGLSDAKKQAQITKRKTR